MTHYSGRSPMNVERATQLRALGLTCREVGIRLAKEEGRAICYTETAVSRAVNLALKAKEKS